MAYALIPRSRPDPHTHYRPQHPQIIDLVWKVSVDFGRTVLRCEATLSFNKPGIVVLDTRDLVVATVFDDLDCDKPIEYVLGGRHPIFGSSLTFRVPLSCRVIIVYETSPEASGVQWLAPEQTGGKQYPFMFTQAQSIHARSFLPCQDTPAVRFTNSTILDVPKYVRGLMAAPEHGGRKDLPCSTRVTEEFKTPYPIPSYLLATAVGDLHSEALSGRTRVWTEKHILEAACDEFAETPDMMHIAEGLFGPYPWGRYDLLVMPASFPYGGMENPCLSFLTPSLIAGDKSGAHVVAHELMHSWTGNLVTNESWEDFSLNEGWTVYAEYRIVEMIWGTDMAKLSFGLLQREFERDVALFISKGQEFLLALCPNLEGIDPDEVFSRIPYYKSALLLHTLEQRVGRPRFDVFIKKYMDAFRFSSINCATFIQFVMQYLPGAMSQKELEVWFYEPIAIPEGAVTLSSPMLDDVLSAAKDRRILGRMANWNSIQWGVYLEACQVSPEIAWIVVLDELYKLSQSPSTDVRFAFLLFAIESGVTGYAKDVEAFLMTQGRLKYVRPLYRAMRDAGWTYALTIYEKARPGYHPIAQHAVDLVLFD